ncbi:MAG TPA: putative 2OG-Fe(II) oxygenase [Rhizomicrobium sp.]
MARLRLLEALIEAEDFEAAIELRTGDAPAAGIMPDWDRRHVLALQAGGRLEAALHYATEALGLVPDNDALLLMRAELLIRLRRWTDADLAVQQVLERTGLPLTAAMSGLLAQRRGPDGLLDMLDRQPARFQPGAAGVRRIEALLALGRDAEALRWMDADALLWQGALGDFATAPDFNRELAAEIAEHSQFVADPFEKATRNGQQANVQLSGTRLVPRLLAAVRGQVEAYAGRLPSACPQFASLIPARARLEVWTVRLERGGCQAPHTHASGWLSGVYYLTGSPGGALEVPLPPEDGRAAPWPTRKILPEPGRLVLFPSYFRHATIPHDDDAPRLSVAFDVVPYTAPASA